MKHLLLQTLQSLLLGVIVFALLLFLPAWTLNYWQGWLFIVVFLGAANAIGVYLSLNDPELLERRKRIGPGAETNRAQKIIASLIPVGAVVLLLVCVLDHRFGGSPVPDVVSLLGDALILLGFLIDFFVFRENTYGASNIQVTEGQEVISTGLYAVVRHPMYLGVLVMMLGVPAALGSLWGYLALALMLPVLIWRILDEEKTLKRDLQGYQEYTQKVRYRLIPALW